MAGILGDLFGSRAKIPDPVTVDATAEANKAADYNTSQIGNYENYAPGFTDFIKNLYSQTVNPQATQAQNTQYNLGNQLATQGYSDVQSNFLNYARQQGLEQAASTGAPLSGSFAQGLGTNISMQQLLGNQLQGTSLLNNYAQNQQSLAQSFINPSLSVFNNDLSNPGQFLSVAQNNAATQNQFNMASAQAASQASPFGNFLTSTFNTVLGKVAGAYSGGLLGGAAQGGSAGSSYSPNSAPYAAGFNGAGIPIAQGVSSNGTYFN